MITGKYMPMRGIELTRHTCVIVLLLLSSLELVGQKRNICITIDDLPATAPDMFAYQHVTDSLLSTIRKYNIPAIGFVNENRLYTSENPDPVRVGFLEKWLEQGLELGNHTYSHIYINNSTIEEYKEDVIRGEEITKRLLAKHNKQLTYFRHTQLRTGPTDEFRIDLDKFLKERGYTIAPVTIDNDEYIYAYCYARAKSKGDIQLMKNIGTDYVRYMVEIFDYYEKLSLDFLGYEPKQTLLIHANNLNADYLEELVKVMKSRQYEFISMEEALTDKAYELPEGTHARGPSWIHRWMIASGLNPTSQPDPSQFITALFNKMRQ